MRTLKIIGLIMAIGTVLAFAASAQNRGTNHESGMSMHGQQAQGAMGGMMGGTSMHQQGMQGAAPDMQGMMGDEARQQMMSSLQEQDAELQKLVKRMNAATGDARVEALVGVVNELANRQTAMRHGMMDVQPQMMRQMMEHMNGGMMSGMGSMMMGGDPPAGTMNDTREVPAR